MWWGLGMRVAAFILLLGFLIGCQGEGRFPDTYKCHFCLEQVKVGAKKCKHCGEDPYDGAEQTRLAHLLADDADELGTYDIGKWPWQRNWPWWKWPVMLAMVLVTFLMMFNVFITRDDPFWGARMRPCESGELGKYEYEKKLPVGCAVLLAIGILVIGFLLLRRLY